MKPAVCPHCGRPDGDPLILSARLADAIGIQAEAIRELHATVTDQVDKIEALSKNQRLTP